MRIAVVIWTFAWLFVSRWFWDSVWYIKYRMWYERSQKLLKENKRLQDEVNIYKQKTWMWKRRYETENKAHKNSILI